MANFNDPLPCGPYTTPASVLACCPVAQTNGLLADSPQLLDAIADASLLLYYWTGRQFGLCDAVVRPCVDCGCTGGVGCNPDRIDLGLWPIVSLTSVRYGGVDQSVADFHIDEFHYLVRSNNQDPWPSNTSSWAEAGSAEDNADDGFVFEVGVQYGIAVPHLLERATRIMACELLNDACMGQCKLPDRVTSVARRGVSMEVASSSDLLNNKLTGIFPVDLAIKTLNPTGMQSPSFVWTPQLARNRVSRRYV